MKENNIILTKTFDFSLKIIELYKFMVAKNEFVISKQLLRSETSIGANVEKGTAASSKKDFINKMALASKEARESRYWLRLLQHSQITKRDYKCYIDEINEIIRIITAIVKTSQENLKGGSSN